MSEVAVKEGDKISFAAYDPRDCTLKMIDGVVKVVTRNGLIVKPDNNPRARFYVEGQS